MSYIAWHFAKDDYTMSYGDGRKLEAGKTYRTIWPCNGKEKPTLCHAGMHGSLKALDALAYAPGSVVCLTEIYGNVQIGDDKIVGKSRKILKMANAEDTLGRFARLCALDVVHLWDAPQIVIDYLNTGDKKIQAGAARAAWAAEAARAAWDAAEAAAEAAARAAWDAAEAAAEAAARAAWAVRDAGAVRDAWAAQNKRLEAMLHENFNHSI